MRINIIGAGLAGCDAALYLAKRGVPVTLYEQKPHAFSPAHHSAGFAELVCSNSLKAERLDSASGLLKAEMELLGSSLLPAARACSVPAGGALAVDDTRWAVEQSRRQYTALLVTEGNVFLEEALRLRPELNLVLAGPQDAQAAAGCDLYIYDGVLPEALPETGAIWAVNPPEPILGITPGEAVQGDGGTLRAAVDAEAAEICEHLLLTDVAIRSFRPLAGGTPVLLSGGETLLALSEGEGRRAAALGFDLHDSNLPLKADFPVMVQNLLSWLLPDAAASVEAAGCGAPVSFALDARSESAWVETPDGQQIALEGTDFADTDAPGVYRLVETLADGQVRETAFALHIPPEESDTLTVPASTEGAQARDTSSYREWTGWVLAALFAVMLLEWEVSRRGTGI